MAPNSLQAIWQRHIQVYVCEADRRHAGRSVTEVEDLQLSEATLKLHGRSSQKAEQQLESAREGKFASKVLAQMRFKARGQCLGCSQRADALIRPRMDACGVVCSTRLEEAKTNKTRPRQQL